MNIDRQISFAAPREKSTIWICRDERFNQAMRARAIGLLPPPDGILEVPITLACRRKYHLMQEDSITLVFSLEHPFPFRVGDYITDELFGTFRLREKQMPVFNRSTGGWDYTLRFDKEYWLWENHIFMLAAPKENRETRIDDYSDDDELNKEGENNQMLIIEPYVNTTNMSYVRRESKWSLTAPLKDHAEMVICNLLSININLFGRLTKVRIHSSAEKAAEVRFLSYDGIGICSALTMMANEYECEWWVTYEKDGNVNYVIVHFGKCEYPGEPLEFQSAHNVENMTINRDLTNYANRLYIFGGTRNIPDTYRRRLILNIDTANNGLFCDSTKKIEPNMVSEAYLHYQSEPIENWITEIHQDQTVNPRSLEVIKRTVFTMPYKEYLSWQSIVGKASVERVNAGTCEATIKLNIDGVTVAQQRLWENITIGSGYKEVSITIGGGNMVMEGGTHDIVIIMNVGASNNTVRKEDPVPTIDDGTANHENCFSYITHVVGDGLLLFNGVQYLITFNPDNHSKDEPEFYMFSFNNGTPTGFGENSKAELLSYDPLKIPMSWFTDEVDNPSSVIGYGERRLRLPMMYRVETTGTFSVAEGDIYSNNGQNFTVLEYGSGYLLLMGNTSPAAPASSSTEDLTKVSGEGSETIKYSSCTCQDEYLETDGFDEEERVERVLVADNIYPKCYLRVSSVEEDTNRKERMELSDGTTYTWPWTAYKLKLTRLNGGAFKFRQPYIKVGEKLQAMFLSDMDTNTAYDETGVTRPSPDTAEYLLAGMTFDVSFEYSPNGSTYTLIRNEDYGAKLPNDILKPSVGDVLVLIGWDVKAMSELQIINDAENRLLTFAKDYLNALNEDGFTFRCEMMSEWPWFLGGGYDWDEAQLLDTNNNTHNVLLDSKGRELWSSLGRGVWDDDYLLPQEGTRVKIVHEALTEGYKVSRVIGYELKLDIPYDSPIYEVGETDAYSRIKQLERKLQNVK